MAQSQSVTEERPAGGGAAIPDEPRQDRSADVDVGELLDLLGDEYACSLLRALETAPRTARELADRCGISRPTVYRRLNRLAAAGIVAERDRLASDGHHPTEFRLVADTFEFELGPEGIDGHVRRTRSPEE